MHMCVSFPYACYTFCALMRASERALSHSVQRPRSKPSITRTAADCLFVLLSELLVNVTDYTRTQTVNLDVLVVEIQIITSALVPTHTHRRAKLTGNDESSCELTSADEDSLTRL